MRDFFSKVYRYLPYFMTFRICSRPRFERIVYGICAFVLTFVINHASLDPLPGIAQSPSPQQLLQSGVEAYQQGDTAAAIDYWEQALEAYPANALAHRALTNENMARAYRQRGDTALALDYWAAAATAYRASGDAVQFGRMLSEQAQTYISRGQYARAVMLACGKEPTISVAGAIAVTCEGGAHAIAQKMDDPLGQTAALGNLAEASRLMGEYETAQNLLTAGMALVKEEGIEQYAAPMLASSGSLRLREAQVALRRARAVGLLRINEKIAQRLQAEAKASVRLAVDELNRAVVISQDNQDSLTELRAQLNLLLSEQVRQNLQEKGDLSIVRQRLESLVSQLPPSRDSAYAAIAIANTYQATDKDFTCKAYRENSQQQNWLEEGLRRSKLTNDTRAESFALGELGHIAECTHQWEEAAYLTGRAQLTASDAQESADSLYLWEWQAGRIYQQQGDLVNALAAYEQAVSTLETIRSDILTANRELQFDFRDSVEPIYRQFIALQLEDFLAGASTFSQVALTPQTTERTLATIDSLRLAELQNFFGNDCVLTADIDARTQLLENAKKTTVISSVVLDDEIVLIANFPDRTSSAVRIPNATSTRQTANEFRRGLKRYRDFAYNAAPSKALYQQLISPFLPAFERTGTKTLVFVQDGFLRNLPMSALFDGQQYLIEQYAVATTPALSLTVPTSKAGGDRRALIVGLSEPITTQRGVSFGALASVPAELAAVAEQLPDSKVLLDSEFTTDALTAALAEKPYSVLHLATHGQFSTIPEETFILTGSKQTGTAGELTFGELETLIGRSSPGAEPVDLIALTACETATGDDRATLGLAGVAIRAGARSAIASLWKVDDAAVTATISAFYARLQQPEFSKAQALQQAQISIIERDRTANPGSWAPLILVGNWQ